MDSRILEILQYTLKPGSGAEFHRIMQEISIPLHAREGMDVVAYGQSLHDPDAYYLMRAFDSQEALAGAEARFYSSDGWLSGPRMAIIERIENSLKSVISMPTAAIDALRTQSVNL
ncbi:NIPSNAP [Yersinia intermedia]|uniref:putative quinol monooxygenase n=1 Tax=Yersinia intermedia TaxID=631 RepID=UPI0005E16DAD|nr:antibiotic biosynthesis monooxygenase [Yersinia intermedia]WET15870.1 NIPSNAP family protein [Yersinia intermedia]CQJ58115.1 NIPSNAP [Yersinia intermedia]